MEESNPPIAYVLCVVLLLLFGYLGVVLVPCLLGVFRSQTHRCPKCLNEIKEDSIWAQLDDNILSFKVGQFGFMVTRRFLIKTLMFLLASLGAFMVYEMIVDGPGWYLEGREPELDLTWRSFVHDIGAQFSHRGQDAFSVFSWKYRNKLIQWEGQVLRVDGNSQEDYPDVKDDAIWSDDSNWTSTSTLINSAASAEILVRMNPPLQGLYSGADHDLELTFDEEHFTKN